MSGLLDELKSEETMETLAQMKTASVRSQLVTILGALFFATLVTGCYGGSPDYNGNSGYSGSSGYYGNPSYVGGGGETWYQGHPGRWYQQNNQWRWRDADDGNEYYRDQDQYRWRSPYTPYRARNPQTDRESYQQYQQTHPGAH
jgi:hypothetical protein